MKSSEDSKKQRADKLKNNSDGKQPREKRKRTLGRRKPQRSLQVEVHEEREE